MKLLYLGDIVGRSGRMAVCEKVPELRRALTLDFVVVNGENAAGGFGITEKICQELFAAGVDVITTGNHVWDQREIIEFIDREPRLLRPINYPRSTPGRGCEIYSTANGQSVFVVNVMGRVFMDALDDPFAAVEAALVNIRIPETADFILVDIHAEASSEKMAIAHFLDAHASLVVGSHGHVPTADTQILRGGTAYQTDAGMCADYDSVIGMEKSEPVRRFIERLPGTRYRPAQGPATLCGIYVETDDATGRAVYAAPLRLGGRLGQSWPLPGGVPLEMAD